MSINKIICLGDGFATGHIWPEWPQLLSALMPDYSITTIAGIGAGAEFLVSELLQCNDIENSYVIFQWPEAKRFDKLVQDSTWDDYISRDQVYSKNFVNGLSGKWWLSSASTSEPVEQYHKFYVQSQQAELRQHIYKQLVKSFLKEKNCSFTFASTEEQDSFSRQKRFKNIRQDQVQPSPLIHLRFLVEVLLPSVNLFPDKSTLTLLDHIVSTTIWEPYHPDRQYIWNNIIAQLHKNA